jgi:CheY-like chemotaxis protein
VAKKSVETVHQKILVVDDNERVRSSIRKVVEVNKLQIATAANVGEALHLIEAEPFDVLLSDLHMTEEGDGLSAVSAMHKTNPLALTLVYTGYPELKQALDVILEAEGVIVKPETILTLPEPSRKRMENHETRQANLERVSAILKRDVFATIIDWLDRVERDGELTRVPLSREERTGHLPQLIRELAYRLQVPRRLWTKAVMQAAAEHGRLRYLQAIGFR